jgi:hypothetical protein
MPKAGRSTMPPRLFPWALGTGPMSYTPETRRWTAGADQVARERSGRRVRRCRSSGDPSARPAVAGITAMFVPALVRDARSHRSKPTCKEI